MAALSCSLTGWNGTSSAEERAHFEVTDRVIAQGVEPFAATVGAIGNGADFIRSGSGFEPVIYRDWFVATEDAANRVIGSDLHVSANWTLANGALDGAEVEILRLANGAFEHVRTDRVAPGGHRIGGWRPALKTGQIIAPRSGSFTFSWDGWNRRNVPYYFTLRTVDRDGLLSERSNSIMAVPPETRSKKQVRVRGLIQFELPKEPAKPGLFSSRPDAPGGLQGEVTGDGRLELSWTRAGRGIAGYLLEISETDPASHDGFGFALEGRGEEPVRAGDLVIVRKELTTLRRDAVISNRAWTGDAASLARTPLMRFQAGETDRRDWRLVRHMPDTPVAEPGETYLELTLADGETERIGRRTDGGLEQNFFPVLMPNRTYKMDVWLKADQRTRVVFEAVGYHGKGRNKFPKQVLDVGQSWRRHVVDFSPSSVNPSKNAGQLVLAVEGPVTLSIDNFRIYEATAPYLDLVPEAYQRVRQSGVSTLRTHAMVKTRNRTYGLAQLTDPGGLPEGIKGQNSLPQSLAIFETAGVRPWLQIEPHFSRDEWLGLVEYLAAPFDPSRDTASRKPWAAKRHAQGRTAPWLDAFDRLYLEVGNETWNFPFKPWIFGIMNDLRTGEKYSRGEVYGLYQTYISNILRKSPYWTQAVEDKIITVLGGWEARPVFGADAAERAPSADLLTTAPYIGGWEVKAKVPEETPQDFFKMLTHVEQVSGPLARRHLEAVERINAGRTRPLGLGTYEAGPGYIHPKSKKATITPEESAAQERVMKSLASGTATLDAFLMRAALGYDLQTFFALDEGERWSSHAVAHRGGHPYPAWQLLSVFNREGTGDMLEVEATRVPTADLAETRRREGVQGAPLVAAYATRDGDRVTVFLLSRMIPGEPERRSDGLARVTVDLPFERAASHRRFQLTGAYNDHNVNRENVRLEETDLGGFEGGRLDAGTLAPAATQIFVFEGVR